MKQLKILIAILAAMLIFLLGYSQSHTEAIYLDLQQSSEETVETSTGSIEEEIIYTWEMTLNDAVEKVNNLVGDYNISYAVVHECADKTEDYKLCIRNLLGVANAESSLFSKGMYPSRNGFGLMQKTSNGYIKRKFSSVEESIQYWVNLYVEKGWGKRTTGADWLKGKYCTSACSNWTKAYNAVQKKLEL